jgi:hypothetical protein
MSGAAITILNDGQDAKKGEIWRLHHHNWNTAWPPWKQK